MTRQAGLSAHITGVVQGVGFRPFVFALAERYGLSGWVRNTSAGVDIEVDGEPESLVAFAAALSTEAPALARIEKVDVQYHTANGYTGFEIRDSAPIVGAFQPISPDVSICPDCLRELLDPADRRHRYPFINCTNCGPRFTIIKDIPYDRPGTTMAPFTLCAPCAREYHDPLDRRFHAQPVACPACGPEIWVERPGSAARIAERDAAMAVVQTALTAGQIVAVKGLGGFHLACDATNRDAVATLRARKLRVDKPFAVMMPDLEAVNRHCPVSPSERALLETRERPIVVLERRPGSPIAGACAPGQATLGVMLPYTPLHYLMFSSNRSSEWAFEALVMTSGNFSEEPIAYTNEDARGRLGSLADLFLLHNREIFVRCDDSVMRVLASPPVSARTDLYPIRRSRGYAPFPVHLPNEVPPLLAVGAELKNAFCLTRGRHAFLSQHIGDMENYETLQSFEQGVAHFERLFRVQPEILAYDLHPDYLATMYARDRASREEVPAFAVQHHHAHIAALMAERGLDGKRPIIGVAFDGTGYGTDGAIWGGEFLIADYVGFERPLHLTYIPLPGGDQAVRHPWRTALAWLALAGVPWESALPPVGAAGVEALAIVRRLVEGDEGWQRQVAPRTSSMGRLFDAVASLAGIRHSVNYEGQAAIELEASIDAAALQHERPYPSKIIDAVVDPTAMIRAISADVLEGTPTGTISARFHLGVAELVLAACRQLRATFGLKEVALSGGVWQNMALLGLTIPRLQNDGFVVYVHQDVPANDGGLALGQAVIAAAQWERDHHVPGNSR